MQKALLLILTIGFSLHLAAQEVAPEIPKEKQPWQHEIGLNANFLLDRLLNFGGDPLPNSPYLLLLKSGKQNWAIRAGIGGATKESVRTEEGFADSQTNNLDSLEYRLGFEMRKQMGKRWVGTFGLDAVGFYKKNKTVDDSGFDVITSSATTQGYGIGPVIGVQFNITKHLSLYTEGYFYYTFSDVEEKVLFQNFPQFDDISDKIEEQELKIMLPSTLYLIFTF